MLCKILEMEIIFRFKIENKNIDKALSGLSLSGLLLNIGLVLI